MSKGEIVSHLGDGQYRVRLMLAVDRVHAEIQRLDARLAELATAIPETELERIDLQNQMDDIVHAIDLLISDLNDPEVDARGQITELQKDLIPLQAETRQVELKLAQLKSEDLAARKRRGQLQAVPEYRELVAWCADYSLDLDGVVGLADINDEGGQGIVIQPGFEDGAAYDAGRDGALFPNLAQSGPQIYFNTAILPGVQKWMPRYRVGVISAIESDFCTVTLDPAASSAQALDINQAEILTDVPITYMDCNAQAFEDGDRVLVRFTQSGPLVVGFETEPTPCGVNGIICTPMQATDLWAGNYFGPPFEDEQGEINPPLGTQGLTAPAWIFTLRGSAPYYQYERGQEKNYGLRNWIGKKMGDVLSWDGPPSRICDVYGENWLAFDELSQFPIYSTRVYYKNRVICYSFELPYIGFDTRAIAGAAIVYKDDSVGRWLRVCITNLNENLRSSSLGPFECKVYDVPWSGYDPDRNAAVMVDEYVSPNVITESTGMYFSESGGKGVMCRGIGGLSESTLVMRFSETFGITETEESVPTPIITRDTEFTSGGDLTTGPVANETSSGYRAASQPSTTRLIGYEFVGEDEVPVTIEHGPTSFSESRSAEKTYQTRERTGGGWIAQYKLTDEYDYAAFTERGYMRLKFGGDEIFGISDALSSARTSTGRTQSLGVEDGIHYIEITETDQINETSESTISGSVVIDARFGIFAGRVSRRTTSRTKETALSGDSSFVSYGSSGGSGTIHLIESETVNFEVYRWGQRIAHAVDYARNESDIDPSNGFSVNSVDVDDPTPEPPGYIFDRVPRLNPYGSPSLRQASVAQANGRLMCTFVFDKTDGTWGELSYMDGVDDPVQEIMQRGPGDGFVFGNISMI